MIGPSRMRYAPRIATTPSELARTQGCDVSGLAKSNLVRPWTNTKLRFRCAENFDESESTLFLNVLSPRESPARFRCRISPPRFAVLTISAKTTTDSSGTRIVKLAAALLRRKIMSYPRPRPEDNDAGERQVRRLVLLDRCLTYAGQMLDHLLGRFAVR